MVVDSSALIAILLGEPEAKALARARALHRHRYDGRELVWTALVITSRLGPQPGGHTLWS